MAGIAAAVDAIAKAARPARAPLTQAQKDARNAAARRRRAELAAQYELWTDDRRAQYDAVKARRAAAAKNRPRAPLTQAQKDARNARARAKTVADSAALVPAAEGLFADAYDVRNFKSAKGAVRAFNYDMSRAGPYARSIATYKPRKNDWPGVDDLGRTTRSDAIGVFAAARKKRVSSKPPSAKQLAARAAFAERYGRR